MPLPFCALSIEFPQRIKYKYGGYTSGKMLRAKLEMGKDDVCFGMKESDFNIRVRSLVADGKDLDIEQIRREFQKPSKVKIIPKSALLRPVNTCLTGPISQEEIDKAAAIGQLLHGWTGEKCKACLGSGERRSTKPGYFGEMLKCEDCGGTGDEYGELKAK